jgi:DNA-directed RNA polymerase subunit beta
MIKMSKRIDYRKTPNVMELPHLLEVQLSSYDKFLQLNVPREKRKNSGLESVFR